MAEKKKTPDLDPLGGYTKGTGEALASFIERSIALATPESELVIAIARRGIDQSFAGLTRILETAVATAGTDAEDVQQILDSFGALELIAGVTDASPTPRTPHNSPPSAPCCR